MNRLRSRSRPLLNLCRKNDFSDWDSVVENVKKIYRRFPEIKIVVSAISDLVVDSVANLNIKFGLRVMREIENICAEMFDREKPVKLLLYGCLKIALAFSDNEAFLSLMSMQLSTFRDFFAENTVLYSEISKCIGIIEEIKAGDDTNAKALYKEYDDCFID